MGITTPSSGEDKENVKIQELAGKEKNEIFEALYGNTKAILEDLKENHVKIEKNAEMMGRIGKKVYIDLPAVGHFEGFKFSCFVSDDSVFDMDFERAFEKNPEIEEKSYSRNDVSNLLEAINKFMTELGCEEYGNRDYPGNILSAITGLYGAYRLSDYDVIGRMSLRAVLYCDGAMCTCRKRGYDDISTAKLFLRLSD